MIAKGKIFSGILRGQPLIGIYYQRILSVLGFEPFKGTLDVRLERDLDVTKYATRKLEHRIMHGYNMINAWFAPVKIIVSKDSVEEKYECWAMKQKDGPYCDNVLEIIAKDRIKDKFGLNDGDEIQIEFIDQPQPEKKGILDRLKRNN